MSDEDFIVDLREYKDRQGSLIPDGRYTVQVVDVEYTKAQSSGNKVIMLFLRVVGGPEDGATLVDRLTQTPNALFRTVNFMRAIGMATPNKRLKITKRGLVNKVLDVDVEAGEPYLGNVRSEVKGYLKAAKTNGSKSTKVADEDDEDDELEGMEEFDPETTENPAEESYEEDTEDEVEEDEEADEEDEEEDAPPPPPVKKAAKKSTAKKATAKKAAKKPPVEDDEDEDEIDIEEATV